MSSTCRPSLIEALDGPSCSIDCASGFTVSHAALMDAFGDRQNARSMLRLHRTNGVASRAAGDLAPRGLRPGSYVKRRRNASDDRLGTTTGRKPTIYDIARVSGASPSTVSAVLSGRANERRIKAATELAI